MRTAILCVVVVALVPGCGGGSTSVDDYVEVLNAMNAEYAPQGEAIWLEYGGKSVPTVEDVRALVDAAVALRRNIDEALSEVEAPEQIAELHGRWTAWHARLLAAEKALAARAATASTLNEYVQGAEMQGYLDTLKEGKVLCAEVEGTLNSTDAQELFADTAWLPTDLTEVVHAVIGCDSFPEDIDEIASLFIP